MVSKFHLIRINIASLNITDEVEDNHYVMSQTLQESLENGELVLFHSTVLDCAR
jgi:hypothetical protein